MADEERKWYYAKYHSRGRLTGKRKRGYVVPVKVIDPKKYLNRKGKP
jgi:hypothetical protein